ncbi:ribonuclease HII [archaeon]|jgi:ribonuclease HII|nr:ribonuclease HII [archaeon]MBT4273177.1 ribonuclease HII [archaeon]MBT4460282.1 ribonuclease HII [archaeon]MBT4858413.1 ribonuclease HII [archaeon]MBT5423751.1 ribonuclease HII [archaeon]
MAGVTINEKDETKLKEIGVKDSKLVPKDKRELLFKQILSIVKDYKIISLTPDIIDKTLLSTNSNLNKLEAETTTQILNYLKPKKAIIDLPDKNQDRYQNYIKKDLTVDVELITEHKADYNYPVVAAASILAKVTRDRYLNFLKEQFGEDFGSGYMTDEKTTKFLEKHWNNTKIHFFRKEWQSWKNMKIKKTQKRLFDY